MSGNTLGARVQEEAGGHKLTEKATLQEYTQLQETHSFLGKVAQSNAERQKAIADYFASGAEQNKQQGQNLKQSANVNKTIGFGFIALGASMKAMAAIPFVGPIKASAGIEMMAKGAGKVAEGVIQDGQANRLLAAADQALEKVLNHSTESKESKKVARKEINRSHIFQRKIDVLRDMLNELGIDNEGLSEKELEDLKIQFAEGFDKQFEDAAQTLLNGGIMALDGLTDEDGNELGTQFFIKEGDDYFALDVPRDDDGNPLTGARGEPLIKFDDEEGRHIGDLVEDGEVKDLLDMKFRFVEALQSMAVGLTTTELDGEGNLTSVPYDLNNREHLEEFTDLVFKSNISKIRDGIDPTPLLLTQQGSETGLQRVEYNLDPLSENFGEHTPVGIFVSFTEMDGGLNPREDGIESFTYALERGQRSLAEVGLNQGGRIYGFVGPTANRQADLTEHTDNGSHASNSTRGGSAHLDFMNSITTLNEVRGLFRSENDLLSGSQGDVVGDGQA